MRKLFVRLAAPEDSNDIWTWRNDALTREMSLVTEEIPLESHNKWFEKILVDERNFLYVGYLEEDGARESKVGMCRFQINEEEKAALVSINLNPGKRGQGLSSLFLNESIAIFASQVCKNMNLLATIKKQNSASIKCFTKCGFKLLSQSEDLNYYSLFLE